MKQYRLNEITNTRGLHIEYGQFGEDGRIVEAKSSTAALRGNIPNADKGKIDTRSIKVAYFNIDKNCGIAQYSNHYWVAVQI